MSCSGFNSLYEDTVPFMNKIAWEVTNKTCNFKVTQTSTFTIFRDAVKLTCYKIHSFVSSQYRKEKNTNQ